MARKRKGDKIDGWVVLDKPVGLGSTPAVGKVRRLFGAQKAGHGGTLDPLATGVLPIALGEATKTVPFVMDGRKEYRFTLRFGEARSTEDAEGEVTATSEVRPDRRCRSAPPWPPSSATSSRCRRPSRPSRSTASGPTTWPAPARRSS